VADPIKHPTPEAGRFMELAVVKFKQEAQLMLTTGLTRLAVSRGQQTWYHFGSIATFRYFEKYKQYV